MSYTRSLAKAVACAAFVAAAIGIAPPARAQVLSPYVFAGCEDAPNTSSTTSPGVCDPQPQLDYNYQLGAAGVNLSAASAMALSPDGARVFVAFDGIVEAYSRNVTTGELVYESCLVDGTRAPGASSPLKLPGTCAVAPAYAIDAPRSMTVSADGTSLYLAMDGGNAGLTAVSVGATLSVVNCFKSSEWFGSNPGAYSGACTPVPVSFGYISWANVRSPALIGDPQAGDRHLYVAANAPFYNETPAAAYRTALLHFQRDAATGALTYVDCAGMLIGRQGGVVSAIACGDAGAFDLRNAAVVKTISHPAAGTASVLVNGIATGAAGSADAVARLGVDASGAATVAQCLLVAGGTCQASQSTQTQGSAVDIRVSADSVDAYVNTTAAAHLRFAADGTMSLQADMPAVPWVSRHMALGAGDTTLVQADGGRLVVFDRNASSGALTYRGCAAAPFVYPDCSPVLTQGWSSYFVESAPGGAMATVGSWLVASFVRGAVLKVVPPTNGSVSAIPGTINCGATGSTCQDTYAPGVSVSLAATPVTDYVFDAFGGDCAGSASPCVLAMDADKTVSAAFKTRQFTMTLTGGVGGTVTSTPAGIDCGATCTASFDAGTTITLHPVPAAGYVFGGWTGYCQGALTDCVVLMNQDRAAGATFTRVYTLTVSVVGSGSVSTQPPSAGISCPADCTETYPENTVVTLAATPSADAAFSGWSGACAGTGTCTVTMAQASSVTASFASLTPAAPSNFNAIVTATKVGKKTTYSAALAWTDNASNETAFLVQRYKTAKGKCALDAGFGTVTLPANTIAYTDATAASSTCGYQVAARNGTLTSAWVRDMNVGSGVTP